MEWQLWLINCRAQGPWAGAAALPLKHLLQFRICSCSTQSYWFAWRDCICQLRMEELSRNGLKETHLKQSNRNIVLPAAAACGGLANWEPQLCSVSAKTPSIETYGSKGILYIYKTFLWSFQDQLCYEEVCPKVKYHAVDGQGTICNPINISN